MAGRVCVCVCVRSMCVRRLHRRRRPPESGRGRAGTRPDRGRIDAAAEEWRTRAAPLTRAGRGDDVTEGSVAEGAISAVYVQTCGHSAEVFRWTEWNGASDGSNERGSGEYRTDQTGERGKSRRSGCGSESRDRDSGERSTYTIVSKFRAKSRTSAGGAIKPTLPDRKAVAEKEERKKRG